MLSNFIACQIGIWLLGDCHLVAGDLLPVLHFCLVYLVSGQGVLTSFLLLSVIYTFAGIWFGYGAVISTHHHPNLFHMGDKPMAARDWGLQQVLHQLRSSVTVKEQHNTPFFQLDTVHDVKGKNRVFLLGATCFGDHLLHHLFPTVDHSKLELLYPALQVRRYLQVPTARYLQIEC